MKGTWIVFEGPGVGHFVPKESDPKASKTICGLGFYGDARRWDVGQDVGVIPLCETCKMLSLDTPRKKYRRATPTEKKP